ncbi:MAG: response regulator [Rubrivivax sp.]|nr:response regulator [Rubrivivax sp.]
MKPIPSSADSSRTPRDIEWLVRREQAQMALDRSRNSNYFGPPTALLVCWVLWDLVPESLLLTWLGFKVSVSLWRHVIDRFARQDGPQRTLYWTQRYEAALFADGVLYGMLGTLLLPMQEPVAVMVMVASVIAAAAVGLVVLSCHERLTVAFTMPVILPAALLQLAMDGKVNTYVGVGMLVFLVLVVTEGRRASEHTRSMLRLRFQMDELASQREQALHAAERSNAAKGQFLATVSHEVRTPLHGILGLTRLLQTDLTGSPALRAERLRIVERTGEHLLNIINDVLDHSRIEGGQMKLAQEPFDLARLGEESLQVFGAAAAEKGLRLIWEPMLPQPCWVIGDAPRVRQILLNLLGNAVKFTQHGWVHARLQWEASGGRLRFECSDSGPGVLEADRERVFQPFEQGDGSFARQHGGTGLGLAISRELARAMGGDVRCAAADGGGARFVTEMLLAAAPADLQPLATHTPEPAALSEARQPMAGHVLLVEDNPVNAIVAEAILQRLGLQVTAVTDGQSAVNACDIQSFDVVLMDCQLPGMDGLEACARIRQAEATRARQAVPIVALTANALPGDRERTLAAGMNDHLAKPFTEAQLRHTLERALAAPLRQPA